MGSYPDGLRARPFKNRSHSICMRIIRFLIFTLLILWTASNSDAESLNLYSFIPQKGLPEGWALVGKPETFTRKTLFHRINGQAELFFKYGYQKSIFAIYQHKENPDQQIELDIYDMGLVVQAFGIFSRFKSEERPIGVGLDSFLDDQTALFYKGRYFVMIFSTQPNSPFLKPLASLVASKIEDTSPPPREIALFPKEKLKAGSIQYLPEGLLGRTFLGRGFQGIYLSRPPVGGEGRTEVKEAKLFIALFKNASGAQGALTLYRDDLLKKGKVHQFTSEMLKGEDGYQGKVFVVPRKTFLFGAVGFDEEEGNRLLNQFLKNFDLKHSPP